MSSFSQLAETLKPSEIVRLGNDINDRIRQGEKIFNYTIGDFNPHIFPIPTRLEELIIDAYKNRYTNYPPAAGLAELRTAVASFMEPSMGMMYGANEVLIASGGRPLIYATFQTIVDAGDKVIYAVPSWNNNHYANMNHAQSCVIEATVENNFMPTPADIAAHIDGATLICLCTPQNPTGTTLGREALSEICDLILAENKKRGPNDKKLYLMFDQMYRTLTFGDTQHYNPVQLRPEMKDYTISIEGASKAFAATGVRVGWALAPSDVVVKMRSILSHVGAWAPMAEQKAIAQYLMEPDAVNSFLDEFKAAIKERLDAIYNGFMDMKHAGLTVDAIAPQASIYLTVKIDIDGKTTPKGQVLDTQAAITNFILSEAKLAIVPFNAFGAGTKSPWYRVSIGTCAMSDIPVVMSNLRAALESLS